MVIIISVFIVLSL